MAVCGSGQLLLIDISTSDENQYEIKGKKSGDVIGNKILPTVCALLNCDGGILKIKLTDEKLKVRAIEQRLSNIMGVTACHNLVKVIATTDNYKTDVCHYITIFLKTRKKFVTVNYNLCLPSQEQINVIPGNDPIEEIESVLGRSVIEDFVSSSDFEGNFILNKESGLNESDTVQLKGLKSAKTKANSFATRMMHDNNKFTLYVSGFANHLGGHIYYGINDERVVIGVTIHLDDEKEDVVNHVEKAMNKLIWTEQRITPEKGIHWDIFFEKVKDEDGETELDSTFVVVIFIAPCRGGVFTAEPESYYIHEGKVERMEYDLWWKSFNAKSFSKHRVRLSNIKPVTWSSKKNMYLFIKLSEALVDHRDAGELHDFKQLCNLAKENFKESNAELVVKAGEITIAYKGGKLDDADMHAKEFERLLSSSKDRSIFEVRFLLSLSLIARRKKHYEESYSLSKQGMQKAQSIPPGLCILWLYLECAMNAMCLGFQNKYHEMSFNKMKKEALLYLEDAARIASALKQEEIPYRINDFKHKLCIYKAWVLLNCSVTGEAAPIAPSWDHLKAAGLELCSVFKEQLSGKLLSKFREIEYNLVKSDHFARLSEFTNDDIEAKKRNLEDALEQATTAQNMATDNFNNLYGYAQTRCISLTERVELCPVGQSSTEQEFEGLRY